MVCALQKRAARDIAGKCVRTRCFKCSYGFFSDRPLPLLCSRYGSGYNSGAACESETECEEEKSTEKKKATHKPTISEKAGSEETDD